MTFEIILLGLVETLWAKPKVFVVSGVPLVCLYETHISAMLVLDRLVNSVESPKLRSILSLHLAKILQSCRGFQ